MLTDTPWKVAIPADFATALAADQHASVLFGQLSNSMQRYHIDNITAAKSADTRQRRIDKPLPCSAPASSGDHARPAAWADHIGSGVQPVADG